MDLDRQVLFEQVWTTPISRLCTTYGLSDQGLRKACLALQVPLPARGHWAKIAAGHQVKRPTLPPLRQKDAIPAVRKPRKQVEASLPVSAVPMPDLSALQSLAGPFHPLLRAPVSDYVAAAKEALQMKEKFEWEALNPGRTYKGPAHRFRSWKFLLDDGLILNKTHKKSFLRVSMWTYQRAFRVLQLLVGRLEVARFAVELEPGRERLKASRDGAFVSIRLAEKMQVGKRSEQSSWSKEPRVVRTLSPTGRLFISIEQEGLGEAQVTEHPEALLEDQLDAILAAVEQQHQRSMATVDRWHREREAREESARRQLAERQQLEERMRAEEAERVLRETLVVEAEAWHRAQALKVYLAHLDARIVQGGKPCDDYHVWRSWAASVVSALDPSDRRVALNGQQARGKDPDEVR